MGIVRRTINKAAAAIWRVTNSAPQRQRAFAAAKISRLTSTWQNTNRLINEELRGDLDKLRERSRSLFKDNEYGKKFGHMVRNNVVGANGFKLKHTIYDANDKPDKKKQYALAQAFKRWSKRGACELSGKMSFRDLQRGLIIDAARDGEFLVRKVYGAAANNSFGFALQRIDPSRIDTMYNRAYVPGQNAIVMGVEVNQQSRAVAYHIWQGGDTITGARERVRIPVEEIIHGFIPDDFSEQERGIPWMYAAMLRLNDLGAYRDAAIIAARVGASKMGFYTQSEEGGMADPAAIADGKDEQGNLYDEVEPGMFGILPPGCTGFTAFDPDYPHAQFEPFTKAMLRGIASGIGASYVSLANDLEGVNFSSIRQGVLDERDEWMAIQDWFIAALLDQVFEDFLRCALLHEQVVVDGEVLSIADIDQLSEHEWQGRRWAWVDPLKDARAEILKLNNQLTSRTRICAQNGVDFEEVLSELEQEDALAAEYNVDLTIPEQMLNPAVDFSENEEEPEDDREN